MPLTDRPRERALKLGMKALSTKELFAILIRHGNKQGSALDIAEEILMKYPTLIELASTTLEDLSEIKGVSNAKGLEILAAVEIARRMSFEECVNKDVITNSKSLVNWLNLEIGMQNQELFLVVFLDVRNQILKSEILFKGTLDRSLVDSREIFKKALLYSSTRIIVVHNHPSGNTEPSTEDIMMTEQLAEIGHLMNVELLDHIIVGRNHHFSFKQSGLLD